MTIVLTPELERALAEAAQRRGTTPELLALDYLRQRLLPADATGASGGGATLADFLAGHVGVLASSEHVAGGANLSEESGRRFGAGMVKRREHGRL
ncbi:MAG TPA: hypothetical protein VFX98_11535 [Longimicrobiaceae bacterium]|nr:hypothetical protein [Longimicrobiaceae bacterium]